MPEHYGRRVAVGVGVESTPGTAVAPTFWPKHMKLGFQRKTTTIENTSAMGRNETVNDSAITEKWAEGPYESKLYDITTIPLLYNMFGTLVTTDNADSDPVVKDHTLDISQSGVAKTLTVVRSDPNTNRRHALATLQDLEISCETGGWVMLNGTLTALPGVTNTDTAAYIAENSFTALRR